MIQKIYSMRDSKAGIYHLPFFKNTHGEAERTFRQTVNDPKTVLNMYPEDFDLYYLGEYDDNEGTLKVEETPKHIIKAVHCVKETVLPKLEAMADSKN